MKKIASRFTTGSAWFMLAWFAISYVDILAHNLSANPQYLAFNIFNLIFRG